MRTVAVAIRERRGNKTVLAPFSPAGYRRPMPDAADNLTPARAEDLRACIAYALTSDGRLGHGDHLTI
jgi:hypothetical protein